MEKYAVIKSCKFMKDKKSNGFIFKDNKGKIYFPAKIETETISKLEIGTKYLIWVIKEEEKFGYCRTNIDNVLIKDYINQISTKEMDHYFTNVILTRDVKRFSDDMHNNDNLYRDNNGKIDFSLKAINNLSNYIDKHGIQSEEMEYRFELACLDSYLYKTFNSKRKD